MKKVLVTGGSAGLGLEICRELIKDGYEVVSLSRNHTDGFKELQSKSNYRLHFYPFDFANISEIYSLSLELTKKYGVFWGLVNNAAIGKDGVLGTQHESDIDLMIKVNLQGPIYLTKYISRQMLSKREGRIINISSIIANTGFNGLSVYAATKAGLLGFTKSLARELGKCSITCNSICPGYMDTGMTAGLEGEKLKSIIRRSPLQKLASTTEVASSVTFLLSEKSSAITGTTITVDAGSTC